MTSNQASAVSSTALATAAVDRYRDRRSAK
jgi:hypothetical protein